MATDEEMRRGLEFSQGRAATYQTIADQGGDSNWTKGEAQAEANKFQAWANQAAKRIAERTTN